MGDEHGGETLFALELLDRLDDGRLHDDVARLERIDIHHLNDGPVRLDLRHQRCRSRLG